MAGQFFFGALGTASSPLIENPQQLTVGGDPAEGPIRLTVRLPGGMLSGVLKLKVPYNPNDPAFLNLTWENRPTAPLEVRPDASGKFTFPGLPAGSYRLQLISSSQVGEYPLTLGEDQQRTDLVIPPQ